ncbi:Uncharacterised protein [Candidatus Anstonella stagnisolia]|nr:Uncharacterised protein [Candidatus Anstonella stagnisolia]
MDFKRGQGVIEWAAPTTRALRGQGATEYLVLLAVVLIIALVAISLLGFFPGLALDAKKTQSDPYWKAALPFGILEHSYSGSTGNLTVVLQNNGGDRLTIINITIGTVTFNVSTANYSGVFSGGEKKVYIIGGMGTCNAGSSYEFPVNISYNSTDIPYQRQIGTKPIIGKCA